MQVSRLLATLVVLGAALGCATGQTATGPSATGPSSASFNRPGFYTEVQDGRLWVLRDGSKELAEFKKDGELAKQVTRIGAGPNGMTIKSSDAEVIDAYLAAK